LCYLTLRSQQPGTLQTLTGVRYPGRMMQLLPLQCRLLITVICHAAFTIVEMWSGKKEAAKIGSKKGEEPQQRKPAPPYRK